MISGCGIPLTEFIIEAVIRNGLQILRANPEVIEDIFENFMDPYLVGTFGSDTIKNIKSYIINTEFHIIQSWPSESSKLPCCSINILSSDELPEKAMFSDVASYTRETIPATVVVNMFQPLSYDSSVGYITVPLSVNLTNANIGQIFVDSSDNNFPITAIQNTPTLKRLGIGINQIVDISAPDCFVRGLITASITEIKQIPIREKIVLGVHAKDDPKECKYFYFVLLYILASSRDIFEEKSLQIHNTNISDFSRVLEYLPSTWFSRFINLSFLTWMDWEAGTLFNAEALHNAIRVDKDVVVIPESSGKSIITTT